MSIFNNVEQIEAYLMDFLKKKYGNKVKFHYNENGDLITTLPNDEDDYNRGDNS